MTTLNMRVGMRYVVTKASRDGEFEVGDRIWLLEDGCIMNQQAAAWMPAADVAEATREMEIAPDADWAAAMRADLERKLLNLAAPQNQTPVPP